MSEFVSYNVLDKDYVLEKYDGRLNNRLEVIQNREERERERERERSTRIRKRSTKIRKSSIK